MRSKALQAELANLASIEEGHGLPVEEIGRDLARERERIAKALDQIALLKS